MFVAFLLLAPLSVHAHVTQEFPTPYKTGTYGASNPLEPSGSNFPCQLGTAGLPSTGPTEVTIGEPFNITFAGMATHGGGMCQIGILPGFNPSKSNADFRVIKTQYGCLTTTSGNLDSGAPTPMTATIPAGIEPGEYTQSWTWASKTTNELYMMCAPIKVVAKKRPERRKTKRTLNDLPLVWLANLGELTGSCKVQPQQLVVEVADPGLDVENSLSEGTKMFKAECNGNPAIGAAKSLPSTKPSVPSSLMTVTSAATRPSSILTKPNLSASVPVGSSSTPPQPSPSVSRCQEEGQCICQVNSFSVCTGGKWGPPQPLDKMAKGHNCL
ncbi:hypothetical protein ONS95_002841 [Cadophora gregata]|uniref:uncharacterized protein n=1 Tax=Cadophora gregata TaxID=51156 RepID=UPI0026DA845F|nr:uncharacterized protein ONS95_002841 [Cadophora gregata]KAK0110190.1 hypothetical protein ONS95_002841 [Cadophora gregata]KAK0110193.1 hypothetical protein ONS96_001816 [Cadophora gregata f. sp. sojae]